MRPDFKNPRNQENESFTLNKAFHASLSYFPSDTRNSKFYIPYIPFILMYYHKTSILQLKCGQKYKNLPRL